MMKKNLPVWRDDSSKNQIKYTLVSNPKITVEAHKFDEREMETIGARWYIFTAKEGIGIESSPEFADTRDEAEKVAEEKRKDYKKLKEVV